MTIVTKSPSSKNTVRFSTCFSVFFATLLFLATNTLHSQRVTFSSDFEQWENNLPAGWMGNATTIEPGNVQLITGDVASGEKACRLLNTDTLPRLFSSRKFRIDRAYDYRISFYFKGKAAGNVLIKLYNNDTLVKILVSILASRETWIEVIRPFENSQTLENAELVFEFGQTSEDYGHLCIDNLEIVKTRAVLGSNNIRAKIDVDGRLFRDWDFREGFAITVWHYEGYYTRKHIIYGNHFWIGGTERVSQELYVTAEKYPNTDTMFFSGPIANNYDELYESRYKNVWYISQAEIDYHRENYSNPDYVPGPSIQLWPGNGNTANGEQQFLAPFADVNQNNIYDPANGDYPIIRGDEAIFYIINDSRSPNYEGFRKMGLEIHGLLYAYTNPADTVLFNTVFLHQKVFNLSQNTYDNVRIGKFTDMEIAFEGGFGTDSLRNLVYNYLNEQGDGHSYGYPGQGMVLLNHSLASSVLYMASTDAIVGDPSIGTQYYNYLQGLWKDGSPITYGGTGSGGSTVTNMMFTGYPEADSGWVQPNNGARRSVISTENTTLNPGDFVCFDLAFPYVWVPENYGNYSESVGHLRRFTDHIQAFYNSQNYDCTVQTVDIPTTTQEKINVQVFPNPNNGTFTVALPDDFHANFEIDIYNPLGQKIYHREKLKAKEQVNLSTYSGFGIYVIKRDKKVISRGILSIGRL